ncbi:MAG: anion permease [Halanaerobiales bacterium]|nr:anion permease [Halanaerobiales bacterium]
MMVITLIIALVTYLCMVFSTKFRTPFATLGSGILLIYGTLSNTFPASRAFEKFPTEIIILIVVLAIFAKVFEKNGIFFYIGNQFTKLTKGNRMLIITLIPISIYAGSLFMNNLSIILLFTFISLELAVKFNLKIVPLLVSVIIASNIGGAALPWADTPAVVLTIYTDFSLLDFLSKLFLPCSVYIAFLTGYTILWFKFLDDSPNHLPYKKIKNLLQGEINYLQNSKIKHFPQKKPKHPRHDKMKPLPHEIKRNPQHGKVQYHSQKNVKPPRLGKIKQIFSDELIPNLNHYSQLKWIEHKIPILLFIFLILSICIAPFIHVSIAFVGMFYGALLLIINKISPHEILISLPILDPLVFISSLFFIAGALESSGMLTIFVDYILTFSGNDPFLILICIMVSAFVIATFLSAGPAAVTLLPICLQLYPLIPNKLVYAAFALGILAGSSMLPWSATGGPVMLSEIKRFLNQYKGPHKFKEQIQQIFILKKYITFSIPFSFIILILNTIFLFYLVK